MFICKSIWSFFSCNIKHMAQPKKHNRISLLQKNNSLKNHKNPRVKNAEQNVRPLSSWMTIPWKWKVCDNTCRRWSGAGESMLERGICTW